MQWHQLEYFKTVAQVQHVTRAAEVLAISQPALSRSIAKLEEELGVPLFERRGKNIVLNRYGKTFLRYVEQAMHEIAQGKQVLENLTDPEHGCVSLAFLHSLGTNFVPGLLGKFRSLYPNIDFKLYQNASNFLLEQLESGEIDLCLSSPTVQKENMAWAPLFSEELFIIVPQDHALANRSHIYLTEISQEPFITFKKNYGLRILADQLFQEATITPQITFEGEEIMTVAGLVEAKLGVALIPRIPGLENVHISFLSLYEPSCRRTIGMSWVKDRYLSPAAQKFKDFVLSSFEQPV